MHLEFERPGRQYPALFFRGFSLEIMTNTAVLDGKEES
jgi:hypothetical protein